MLKMEKEVIESENKQKKASELKHIPLELLDDFPNHPFKVRDDEDMLELIESVTERGVLVPAIVRPKANGRYELICQTTTKKVTTTQKSTTTQRQTTTRNQTATQKVTTTQKQTTTKRVTTTATRTTQSKKLTKSDIDWVQSQAHAYIKSKGMSVNSNVGSFSYRISSYNYTDRNKLLSEVKNTIDFEYSECINSGWKKVDMYVSVSSDGDGDYWLVVMYG